jgi:hypothetical protein
MRHNLNWLGVGKRVKFCLVASSIAVCMAKLPRLKSECASLRLGGTTVTVVEGSNQLTFVFAKLKDFEAMVF